MRATGTIRALVIAVAAVVALGACSNGGGGGGSEGEQTVSAQTFVDTVCGELSTWLTALQDGGDAMQEQIAGADPAKARELLTGYLDDAIGATQDAAAAIGEAGAPDVDGGGTIAQAIIGVLGRVEQVFTAARDKVADLPDDRAQFQAGVAEIGADITSAFSENPLGDLQENQALSEAAANSQACQEMNAMSSAPAP